MANVVTDVGLGLITALLAASDHKYLAWGTGTTPPVVTDTALETPAAEARTSGTSTQETTTTTNDTYQVEGTITCAGSAKVITEIGLFDASTSGNLYIRATFSPINVSVGDSIIFTIGTVFDQL